VDPTDCTYNLHISRKIVVYYEEIKRECVRVYARQARVCARVCTTTLVCLRAPERDAANFHVCIYQAKANVHASPTALPYSHQYDSLRTALKNMLQRQTRVVKQINFAAGGRSLNEQDLRDNL
jgi:hypothetical protein